MKKKCCLAIDPVTCKDYMVDKFSEYEIEVFAVFTDSLIRFFDEFTTLNSDEIHKVVKAEVKSTKFQKIYYLWEYESLGEFEEIISGYEVFHIINSNEYSLDITQRICKQFNIYFNSDSTIHILNSKYEVNEVCREKKIPACREILKEKSDLTESEKRELSLWNYPVFAKPVHGCGSLGVAKLYSCSDVENYLKNNMKTSVLIQEYLKGREYFVDVLSCDGFHYISLVGVYKKDNVDNIPVYNYGEVVPFDAPEAIEIIDYLRRILDAVGWENGLTHNEIILTDHGPILVEINGRQSGAHNYINKLAYNAFGRDQFDILIDSLMGENLKKHEVLPDIKAYSRYICLNNFNKDKTMHEFNIKKINKLQSYKEHSIFIKTGQKLPVVRSLADTVGNVLLVNKDYNELEKDYNLIYDMMMNEELF